MDDSFLGRVDVGLSVGKIKGHYVCGTEAEGGKGERKSTQHLEERAVLIREVLYDTAVEKGRTGGELYLPSNLSLALLAHLVLFAIA